MIDQWLSKNLNYTLAWIVTILLAIFALQVNYMVRHRGELKALPGKVEVKK